MGDIVRITPVALLSQEAFHGTYFRLGQPRSRGELHFVPPQFRTAACWTHNLVVSSCSVGKCARRLRYRLATDWLPTRYRLVDSWSVIRLILWCILEGDRWSVIRLILWCILEDESWSVTRLIFFFQPYDWSVTRLIVSELVNHKADFILYTRPFELISHNADFMLRFFFFFWAMTLN